MNIPSLARSEGKHQPKPPPLIKETRKRSTQTRPTSHTASGAPGSGPRLVPPCVVGTDRLPGTWDGKRCRVGRVRWFCLGGGYYTAFRTRGAQLGLAGFGDGPMGMSECCTRCLGEELDSL